MKHLLAMLCRGSLALGYALRFASPVRKFLWKTVAAWAWQRWLRLATNEEIDVEMAKVWEAFPEKRPRDRSPGAMS